MKSPKDVDSYIEGAPKEIRATLVELRRVIKHAAPKAVERISYGMPFYEYGGTGIKGRLVYFAAFKHHISLFVTPWNDKAIPPAFLAFHVTKATYQFSLDEPLPFTLIEKTIKALVKERDDDKAIVDSKPKPAAQK